MINPTHLPPCLRTLSFPKTLYRGLATTNAPKRRPLKIPPSALSHHWDTLPPTPEQLKHAARFFQAQPPTFLWSAPKFKTMDWGSSPEVCFLGRSNVGKSSLLNALLGQKLAHTSSKPGRTKCMNAFAIGGRDGNFEKRLVVLDMPGYGKGGRAEWGEQVLKYLSKRQELKRAFLLVDAEHGVKETDKQLLGMFGEQGVPYQVVLSKVDKVLFEGKRPPSEEALANRIQELRNVMEKIERMVRRGGEEEEGVATGEVIACSSTLMQGTRMGVDAVRFAMLRAAGLEFRPKVKLAGMVEVVPFDEIPGMDDLNRTSMAGRELSAGAEVTRIKISGKQPVT